MRIGHGDVTAATTCDVPVVRTRSRPWGTNGGCWERYVKDASARCDARAGLFEKVGNDQRRTVEAIKAEIAELEVQYEDTPAVGGQAGGR
ncbi:hypothetical protein [Streptomyces sp. NPDC048489]|uniref:hypothetical protein n=1 Tax=Streptomyces sp. NPDC048489 TaxID=3154504 RepID=UPI0034301DA7